MSKLIFDSDYLVKRACSFMSFSRMPCLRKKARSYSPMTGLILPRQECRIFSLVSFALNTWELDSMRSCGTMISLRSSGGTSGCLRSSTIMSNAGLPTISSTCNLLSFSIYRATGASYSKFCSRLRFRRLGGDSRLPSWLVGLFLFEDCSLFLSSILGMRTHYYS